MTQRLCDQLERRLDEFLVLWTQLMDEAGYLAHTTAKREDCVESFRGVMHSIRRLAPDAELPSFAHMLRQARAQPMFMDTCSRNHRVRGVTEGMFMGCFKTFIHSLEQIIFSLDIDANERLDMMLRVRRVCDVLETRLVDDWQKARAHENMKQLQDVNRRLTLKKNRYENIFNGTSDLVILTDEHGCIAEANPETGKYLAIEDLVGRYFWEFLAVQTRSIEQFLDQYGSDTPCEICSADQSSVFNLRLVPLSRVSLASSGYMLILSDITLLVHHRDELERRVAERTSDLVRSRELLAQEKAQTDEMNVTLRNVMKSIESDRQDLEKTIADRVMRLVVPALEKLRHESDPHVRSSYLDVAQEQLACMTSNFNSAPDAGMLKLSRTEVRICHFIQAGCSSKEISEAMNLALDTICTHRKNIRKKLGLQGRNQNLYSYLVNRTAGALPSE